MYNIDKTTLTEEQKLLYEFNMARYQESVIRECAFVPIDLDIDGIPVKQFTMMHRILLDFCNSPFIKEQDDLDKQHIWEFLWIVSTEFVMNNPNKKKEFIESNLKFRSTVEAYTRLITGIFEYLKSAFLDSVEYERQLTKDEELLAAVSDRSNFVVKEESATTSWIAEYISIIASAYGWTDEYILNLPLARVLQYIRCITKQEAIKNGVSIKLRNKFSDEANEKYIRYITSNKPANGTVLMSGDNVIEVIKG